MVAQAHGRALVAPVVPALAAPRTLIGTMIGLALALRPLAMTLGARLGPLLA